MIHIRRIACAVLMVVAAAMLYAYWYTADALDVQTINYADLGDTRVVYGGTNGLAIVLADNQSIDSSIRVAKLWALSGRTVGIVNVDTLFATVSQHVPSCINHVTLLDVYAQFLQQRFEFSHFDRPAVIGVGSGGGYLRLLLAQAPSGIFSVGMSLRSSALSLPAAPCGAVAASVNWQSATQPINTQMLTVSATPWTNFSNGFSQALTVLRQLVSTQFLSNAQQNNRLPLVELPQPNGGDGDYFVVVLSGDGGWANIDKDIAEDLGEHYIAVVGWNTLRYFWQPKSPDTMASDLTEVIKHYQQAWHKQRVVLVGFSLGADVLPFMVSRLAVDVQKTVAGVVLLSPSRSADFQFHISDWLGSDEGSPNPLQPELAKFRALPLLCVYAVDEEDDTVCVDLKEGDKTHIVRLAGDHHFDGDYAAVTREILAWLPVQR